MNELITSKEIQALVGLSRSATHNLTRQVGFPEPYRINARTIRWSRLEVEKWLEARKQFGASTSKTRPTNGLRFTVDGVTFRTVA
jgi:predicted DNA-binding transcriptional regulator AlpA